MDSYFKMPSEDDLLSSNFSSNNCNEKLKKSYEVLKKLRSNTNGEKYKTQCLEDIDRWLHMRRSNGILDNQRCEASYVFQDTSDYSWDIIREIGDIGSVNTLGNVGLNGKYDYRITILNNKNITFTDGLKFIKALISKAKEMNVVCGWKNFWEADAIILYTDLENLSSVINLLEELKKDSEINSVIKKFDKRKMFSAYLTDDSYYGISMGSCDATSTYIKTSFGSNAGGILTFGAYMEELLNDSIIELYNNGYEINSVNLYDLMVYKHSMFGIYSNGESLPLWENHYNDNVMRKFIVENENLINGENEYFYVPTSLDDNDRKSR